MYVVGQMIDVSQAIADRICRSARDGNEVDIKGGVLYTYQINPNNRTGIAPGRIDPNLKNKRDNEVIVGIDHELASNVAVGAAYTFRSSKNLIYQPFISAPCAVGSACSATSRNTPSAFR